MAISPAPAPQLGVIMGPSIGEVSRPVEVYPPGLKPESRAIYDA